MIKTLFILSVLGFYSTIEFLELTGGEHPQGLHHFLIKLTHHFAKAKSIAAAGCILLIVSFISIVDFNRAGDYFMHWFPPKDEGTSVSKKPMAPNPQGPVDTGHDIAPTISITINVAGAATSVDLHKHYNYHTNYFFSSTEKTGYGNCLTSSSCGPPLPTRPDPNEGLNIRSDNENTHLTDLPQSLPHPLEVPTRNTWMFTQHPQPNTDPLTSSKTEQ